jgi:hypothetical protein
MPLSWAALAGAAGRQWLALPGLDGSRKRLGFATSMTRIGGWVDHHLPGQRSLVMWCRAINELSYRPRTIISHCGPGSRGLSLGD